MSDNEKLEQSWPDGYPRPTKDWGKFVPGEVVNAPDIPPALTESEWAARVAKRGTFLRLSVHDTESITSNDGRKIPAGRFLGINETGSQTAIGDVNTLAALIALANAAMNDEDPRKFTREHVTALRTMFDKTEALDDSGPTEEGWKSTALSDARERIIDLADALESYLPPVA